MDQSKFWHEGTLGDTQSPVNKGFVPHQLSNSGGKRMPKTLVKVAGIFGILAAVVFIAAYIFILRPAQAVMAKAKILKADMGRVQQAFVDRDLITVEAALIDAQTHLEDVKTSRNENLAWMAKFGFTKPYYQDTDYFINAGFYGIKAAQEAINLMKPFADAAGLRVSTEQEVQETSLIEAFSNWIAVMPAVAEDLDVVIAELTKAGDELEKVDTAKYPETIRGTEVRASIEMAQALLSDLNSAAPDIKEALTIVPGLLGVSSGEKRYMIIMQNDKEIRPTGGFWTNYATFKINNAMLTSDFSSKDMYSIDLALEKIDAYYDFPDAPAPYARYLKVEHWFARDTNSSPDFPTSVDQFMTFYNMAGTVDPVEIKPVNGVFAIDTQVIKELLEVTGPVTVNGVTYSSDNVVLELERIASLTLSEQVGRKRVLGDLMEAMLVNLFESDKNLWPKLIEKGADLATRKHVLIYFFDPAAQALVEKYNLAGRIDNTHTGDYAYVVSTNLGGDKTNWFVTKDVEHILAKEGARYVRTVSVTYNYPQPAAEYGPFVKKFRDWVRVYVPQGSELISVEGSSDSFDGGLERGRTYFDGFIELAPTETAKVVFKYYLPDGVIPNGNYSLYIQKQPGINTETHVVRIGDSTKEFELAKDVKYNAKI